MVYHSTKYNLYRFSDYHNDLKGKLIDELDRLNLDCGGVKNVLESRLLIHEMGLSTISGADKLIQRGSELFPLTQECYDDLAARFGINSHLARPSLIASIIYIEFHNTITWHYQTQGKKLPAGTEAVARQFDAYSLPSQHVPIGLRGITGKVEMDDCWFETTKALLQQASAKELESQYTFFHEQKACYENIHDKRVTNQFQGLIELIDFLRSRRSCQ